jgi:benzoyl-CoA reductase/2-hydroxyglutaryl-CoA dehydratase subunit BcrC/BadD/HgdB
MSEIKSSDDKDKTFLERKSIKQLKTSIEAVSHQKEWFIKIRERIKAGEPFVIAQADTPHEIFVAMDIPVIPVQWWSAIIAAKRLSPYYFNLMDEKGYKNLCRYCCLPLACAMDHNPEREPWGGLPKPTLLLAETQCDAHSKLFELWAKEYDAIFFPLEHTAPTSLYNHAWENIEHHWDTVIESHRLDLRVEELKALIKLLEVTTGKIFNNAKFVEVMELVNEQSEYFKKARDLIAGTIPSPVGLPDQLPATMNVQWQRGTPWARDQAKRFYEEVKERVEKGEAACKNEKLRLMWSGPGLWQNTAFYQYFEDKYGATFVCSPYLTLAADAYYRDLLGDPLKALAGRHLLMGGGEGSQIKEAKLHHVDGVLKIETGSCKRYLGRIFANMALEDAHIPTLTIPADNVDARNWDDSKIQSLVSNFIEEKLLN